jgi:hypothetical protein
MVHRCQIAGEDRLERLVILPLRVRGGENPDAIEREHCLRVNRMLDPEGAVLIEGGDAVIRRHIARARLIDRGMHKVQDRLLGRSVVPRRQNAGRGLRICRGRGYQAGQRRQHRCSRQQRTAADAGKRKGRLHVSPLLIVAFPVHQHLHGPIDREAVSFCRGRNSRENASFGARSPRATVRDFTACSRGYPRLEVELHLRSGV